MIECRFVARLLALLAWAGAIAALPLWASERGHARVVARRIETARLLELGDHYTASAISKARVYYEQVRAKPGVDARTQYALALVLIRQHCHKEAIELLDEILAEDPNALHVWRAKIWAELALHGDREAMTDALSAADVLAAQKRAALPADQAEACRAAAQFLGRVFGYLALHRPGALPADDVHTARQYVLARLGDEQALFKLHEKLLVQQFFAAQATFDYLRAKRIAVATSRQQDFAKQKQVIDEAEADLDYDIETAKLADKAELDKAIQAVATASTRILSSQFRLNVMREEIQFNRANMAFDPTQDLLGQVQAERALRREINQLIYALPRTVAHSEAVFGQVGGKIEQLGAKATRLRRKERQLERLEQAEAKKIAALQRKTLTTKQMSFATLEPFPFESEKDRVVEMANH
jgi:hypothetical protein